MRPPPHLIVYFPTDETVSVVKRWQIIRPYHAQVSEAHDFEINCNASYVVRLGQTEYEGKVICMTKFADDARNVESFIWRQQTVPGHDALLEFCACRSTSIGESIARSMDIVNPPVDDLLVSNNSNSIGSNEDNSNHSIAISANSSDLICESPSAAPATSVVIRRRSHSDSASSMQRSGSSEDNELLDLDAHALAVQKARTTSFTCRRKTTKIMCSPSLCHDPERVRELVSHCNYPRYGTVQYISTSGDMWEIKDPESPASTNPVNESPNGSAVSSISTNINISLASSSVERRSTADFDSDSLSSLRKPRFHLTKRSAASFRSHPSTDDGTEHENLSNDNLDMDDCAASTLETPRAFASVENRPSKASRRANPPKSQNRLPLYTPRTQGKQPVVRRVLKNQIPFEPDNDIDSPVYESGRRSPTFQLREAVSHLQYQLHQSNEKHRFNKRVMQNVAAHFNFTIDSNATLFSTAHSNTDRNKGSVVVGQKRKNKVSKTMAAEHGMDLTTTIKIGEAFVPEWRLKCAEMDDTADLLAVELVCNTYSTHELQSIVSCGTSIKEAAPRKFAAIMTYGSTRFGDFEKTLFSKNVKHWVCGRLYATKRARTSSGP